VGTLGTPKAFFQRLAVSGIRVLEFNPMNPLVARKDWSTACGPPVGSTNLDWRSFLHNHELNVVVLGTEFGSLLQAMFDKDLAASDAITLGDGSVARCTCA
jgi:cardiolipin synthase